MTAYQITSMLEGVVQRGTGTVVKAARQPIAGKTGTTNDYKDAWFIGFTPDMVVGVYVGYDKPRPLGKGEPDRRPARRADLPRIHEDGARRQACRSVQRPGRHEAATRRSKTGMSAGRARQRRRSSKRSSRAPHRPTATRPSGFRCGRSAIAIRRGSPGGGYPGRATLPPGVSPMPAASAAGDSGSSIAPRR